jgi:hypothetical protein
MYIFDNMYSAEKFLEISPNASLENEDKNAGNGKGSLFSRNRKYSKWIISDGWRRNHQK